jgi:hypothetical protein
MDGLLLDARVLLLNLIYLLVLLVRPDTPCSVYTLLACLFVGSVLPALPFLRPQGVEA